jgi:hypothetical protein
MKSGGAPPHSKTQAMKVRWQWRHVLECGNLLPLYDTYREGDF